jgi:PhnB protein
MRLNPYLSFDGRCEAAFKFYEQCLQGKIVMLVRYGDSPLAKQTPPHWHRRVLHATFSSGDHILQGTDALPESYCRPQGFSVMLNIGSPVDAENIFNALAVEGTVQIPLQESFWAARFGVLVDQFGTPWTINCGKPLPSI